MSRRKILSDLSVYGEVDVNGSLKINGDLLSVSHLDNLGGTPNVGTVVTADGLGGASWEQIPSGEILQRHIEQTAHGLLLGEVIRHDGTSYVKAMADNEVNAEVIGIVSKVIDANNFTLTYLGYITGLSGLVPGSVYFLSETVAGELTTTDPTIISKPLFIAESTTSGYFNNFRGTDESDTSHTHAVSDITGLNEVLQYSHIQDTPASTWTITHNLGRYPSVSIVDSAGTLVMGDIEYVDSNTIKAIFDFAFGGKAYIN